MKKWAVPHTASDINSIACGELGFYMTVEPRPGLHICAEDVIYLDGTSPEPHDEAICGSCGKPMTFPFVSDCYLVEDVKQWHCRTGPDDIGYFAMYLKVGGYDAAVTVSHEFIRSAYDPWRFLVGRLEGIIKDQMRKNDNAEAY